MSIFWVFPLSAVAPKQQIMGVISAKNKGNQDPRGLTILNLLMVTQSSWLLFFTVQNAQKGDKNAKNDQEIFFLNFFSFRSLKITSIPNLVIATPFWWICCKLRNFVTPYSVKTIAPREKCFWEHLHYYNVTQHLCIIDTLSEIMNFIR